MKAAERPSRFRPFPRVATKLRYFSSRFRSLKPSAKYCAGPLTFITDDAKESACSLRWRRGGREVQVSSLRNGSRFRATVGALPFSSSPFFFSGRAWTHSKLYSSLCRSLRQHTFTMTSRNTMAGAPRFALQKKNKGSIFLSLNAEPPPGCCRLGAMDGTLAPPPRWRWRCFRRLGNFHPEEVLRRPVGHQAHRIGAQFLLHLPPHPHREA